MTHSTSLQDHKRGLTSKGQKVVDDLKRRKQLGIPFKLQDIASDLGVDTGTVSDHAFPFIAQLVKELLAAEISDTDDFLNWQRDLVTFRHFLRRVSKSDEIFRKNIRLTIAEKSRHGDVIFSEIRDSTKQSTKLVHEEIQAWEKETGKKSWVQPWVKARSDFVASNPDPIQRSENRKKIVFEYIQEKRANCRQFTFDEMAKATGFPKKTVAQVARVCLLEIIDELIEKTVENDSDFKRWQKDYRTLYLMFSGYARQKDLTERYLRLGIESLHRQKIPIGYSELERLTSCSYERIRPALLKWEVETNTILPKLRSWKEVTLDMVLPTVSPKLHKLPLTFLESPEMGRSFNEKQLRMIFNIKQPNLRNVAFFVMVFADGNRANDISFFTTMSRFLNELSLSDIDEINPGQFYKELHDGKLLPNESQTVRARFVQSYFRLVRRQNEYLRKLTEDQINSIDSFLLVKVRDDHFWKNSKLSKAISNETVIRRKKLTDVVHQKFYSLRDVAERRLIQMERLRKSFFKAIEHHKESSCELPYSYEIADEASQPSGGFVSVRHKLKLWNAKSLRHVHEGHTPSFYTAKKSNPIEFSKREDLYFLSYEGSVQSEDETEVDPLWFFIKNDLNTHTSESNPACIAYPIFQEHALLTALPFRAEWPAAVRTWLAKINKSMGFHFIPTEGLLRYALVGHASTQIMTKTGARMNEFMQIRLDAQHLRRVKLSDSAETMAFWAIPKGRLMEEPYYIDERCMKALFDWWSFQRETGYPFEEIKPDRSLNQKIKPAIFLFQHHHRHLSHNNINVCMRFLFLGLDMETEDGDPVNFTSHLLRHSFATELRSLDTPIDIIGLLMKQRDIKVTEYYSKPTPTHLVALQRQIFETRLDLSLDHIRSSAQIKKQILDAQDTVGALIPVLGGNCTIPNKCPAKFACVGCAGNAPDPSKRQQVLEYKLAYLNMAEMANIQNLPAERRKALEILSNCDDMLMEMDLIEKTDIAAAEPVTIISKRGRRD